MHFTGFEIYKCTFRTGLGDLPR